jgi:hypothetical protein
MVAFELDYPFFCANSACELHVQFGSPGVRGRGNWAEMPDGRVVGRSLHGDGFLCDLCMRRQGADAREQAA